MTPNTTIEGLNSFKKYIIYIHTGHHIKPEIYIHMK